MGEFETNSILKAVLYNKDGTVDYVFDNVKLDEIISSLKSTEGITNKGLFLSRSKSGELSFEVNKINEDVLYQIGVIHWYDWWDKEHVEYLFKE